MNRTSTPKISRDSIVSLLDKTLRTSDIPDRSVNGLQVEGAAEVTKIGLAVDASLETYKLAKKNGCLMVIVHHGMIWEGIKSVTGPIYKQIKFLAENNINLYASHLPLDLHPTLGNNILIAKTLRLKNVQPFGMYKNGMHIGYEGYLPRPAPLKSVSELMKKKFGGQATVLPFGPQKISRVAIISGGGTEALPEAISKKIDLFVTGEPKHENHHLALEGGISVIYGGHYQTETLGVKALGDFLKKKFGVQAVFLDVPTLV
jgi:dinuclear metal center YbgI/SA1388 family protein